MFWCDHDLSTWGWFAMSAGMILFWALLVIPVVWLVRTGSGTADSHAPTTPTPEQLLAERFSRGHINEKEYRQSLATLRAIGDAIKN